MKKTLALVLILMLLASSAMASGLGGLFGGGSSGGGIEGLLGEKETKLPDPAEVIGESGELLQKNYEFAAGYICTAYSFPNPNVESRFINSYSELAKQNGYSVTAASMPETQGLSTYSVQNGDGKRAYIILGVQGNTLLFLVENGMEFETYVKMNTATLVYNGVECEMEVFLSELPKSGNNQYEFSFRADPPAPFKYMTMEIPATLKEGDVFYSERGSWAPGFDIWVQEAWNWDQLINDGFDLPTDYAMMTITKVEKTQSFLFIDGTFEGRFYEGTKTITDGKFHIKIAQ